MESLKTGSRKYLKKIASRRAYPSGASPSSQTPGFAEKGKKKGGGGS